MQLDKLTDLAAMAPEPSRFYSAIVETLRELTEPQAVAVWSIAGQSFRLESHAGLQDLNIGQDRALQELHESGLNEVCQSQDASYAGLPSQASSAQVTTSKDPRPKETTSTGSAHSSGHTNPVTGASWCERRTADTVFNFFACRAEAQVFLVIELVFALKEHAPSPQRLLSAIEEIVQDYHKSTRLRDVQQRLVVWDDLEPVVQRIHAARTLEKLAYEIVNEARRYLNCDRVTLMRVSDGKCQTLAVSGVATLDPRSQQLRSLEQLTANILRAQTQWHYPNSIEEPPQRTDILHEYLDHSGCQALSIHGLAEHVPAEWLVDISSGSETAGQRRPDVLGGLIVESFSESSDSPSEASRIRALLPHVQIAFARTVHFDQLPLMKLSYRLQRWTAIAQKRGVRWLLITLVPALLLASTILIPCELEIVADGLFEPAVWKHIYAPLPGEIVEVLAEHQTEVNEGQPLLRLRNRDLELKKQELVTQRNVSLEKLRGIEAARLGGRRPTSQPTNAPTALELSASERELSETIESLDKQLTILDQMLESLEIKSPMRGQVVSWNTAGSLQRRPVQQGQRLLSLASNEGAGRLQLFLADTDIQHVVRAQEQASNTHSGIKVTFSVATDPSTKHTARIERLGTIVESSSIDGARVRAEALVESSSQSASLAGTRPGATVLARVHCGRSNLAYVWLRRLWERWLLWKG